MRAFKLAKRIRAAVNQSRARGLTQNAAIVIFILEQAKAHAHQEEFVAIEEIQNVLNENCFSLDGWLLTDGMIDAYKHKFTHTDIYAGFNIDIAQYMIRFVKSRIFEAMENDRK